MWLTTTEFVADIFPKVIVPSYRPCILGSSSGHPKHSGQPDGKEQQGEKVPTQVIKLIQVLNVIYIICSTNPTTTCTLSDHCDREESASSTALSTLIGEVLLSDYSVYELPSECSEESAMDTSVISGIN